MGFCTSGHTGFRHVTAYYGFGLVVNTFLSKGLNGDVSRLYFIFVVSTYDHSLLLAHESMLDGEFSFTAITTFLHI